MRFVGNRSSGRMGFALADEAARRGAAVTVVAANVALPRDPAVRYVDVETAAELAAATRRASSTRCDVLLMAAAVADYRPAAARAGKIKKTEAASSSCGSSAPRTSSPALAARRRDGQLLVGFAAETGARARRVRPRQARSARASTPSSSTTSRAPGIGFDAADNEVTIVTARRRAARAA